ncbi:MerR family transcriptional regulator [Streptomyces lydicus]|uniref:MerR family transcriptional regulator n=1 Tax=Streptomyces lydicus TaxID=47763 RepID=UPI00342B18AB
MGWSIAEVARMSGVTSRTLRHYDEIGLLVPAYIGSSGHRHYEEAELLRLQQVLLMRELGLGLREIAAVLASQAAGTPVTGAAVQAEVDAHYRGICRMWTPSAGAFKALGTTYVEDAQWRGAYDRIAEGLAVYQRDAMAVYAEAQLS